jgi:hypothetical protein
MITRRIVRATALRIENAASAYVIAVLVALLAGCAAQTATTPATPTPAPPGAPSTPSAPAPPPPPPVNLQGFPPAYRAGFGDGCATGRGSDRKDADRFGKDGNYRVGWQDGLAQCKAK